MSTQSTTPLSSVTNTTTNKLAAKFRNMAESLVKQIEDKRRPLSQNPTPKRMREYRSRLHDADNLERTQKALLILADGHEAGTLPWVLAQLRTKDEISRLVYKGTESGGYYDVIPSLNYHNTSPAAQMLQQLIEADSNPSARAEQERQRKISLLEADVQFAQIPGFFPTPAALAERLVLTADIRDGDTVLEPSAGKGNIADAIREAQPGANLSVIEYNTKLREILTLKGYTLVEDDFLQHRGRYDRIVMNPPFERGADIDHVMHAYGLLNPGGRLVAIMSEGPFFRNDRQAAEFRAWLPDQGLDFMERLPSGSFTGKDAEVQTGVNTRLVVIDKKATVQ